MAYPSEDTEEKTAAEKFKDLADSVRADKEREFNETGTVAKSAGAKKLESAMDDYRASSSSSSRSSVPSYSSWNGGMNYAPTSRSMSRPTTAVASDFANTASLITSVNRRQVSDRSEFTSSRSGAPAPSPSPALQFGQTPTPMPRPTGESTAPTVSERLTRALDSVEIMAQSVAGLFSRGSEGRETTGGRNDGEFSSALSSLQTVDGEKSDAAVRLEAAMAEYHAANPKTAADVGRQAYKMLAQGEASWQSAISGRSTVDDERAARPLSPEALHNLLSTGGSLTRNNPTPYSESVAHWYEQERLAEHDEANAATRERYATDGVGYSMSDAEADVAESQRLGAGMLGPLPQGARISAANLLDPGENTKRIREYEVGIVQDQMGANAPPVLSEQQESLAIAAMNQQAEPSVLYDAKAGRFDFVGDIVPLPAILGEARDRLGKLAISADAFWTVAKTTPVTFGSASLNPKGFSVVEYTSAGTTTAMEYITGDEAPLKVVVHPETGHSDVVFNTELFKPNTWVEEGPIAKGLRLFNENLDARYQARNVTSVDVFDQSRVTANGYTELNPAGFDQAEFAALGAEITRANRVLSSSTVDAVLRNTAAMIQAPQLAALYHEQARQLQIVAYSPIVGPPELEETTETTVVAPGAVAERVPYRNDPSKSRYQNKKAREAYNAQPSPAAGEPETITTTSGVLRPPRSAWTTNDRESAAILAAQMGAAAADYENQTALRSIYEHEEIWRDIALSFIPLAGDPLDWFDVGLGFLGLAPEARRVSGAVQDTSRMDDATIAAARTGAERAREAATAAGAKAQDARAAADDFAWSAQGIEDARTITGIRETTAIADEAEAAAAEALRLAEFEEGRVGALDALEESRRSDDLAGTSEKERSAANRKRTEALAEKNSADAEAKTAKAEATRLADEADAARARVAGSGDADLMRAADDAEAAAKRAGNDAVAAVARADELSGGLDEAYDAAVAAGLRFDEATSAAKSSRKVANDALAAIGEMSLEAADDVDVIARVGAAKLPDGVDFNNNYVRNKLASGQVFAKTANSAATGDSAAMHKAFVYLLKDVENYGDAQKILRQFVDDPAVLARDGISGFSGAKLVRNEEFGPIRWDGRHLVDSRLDSGRNSLGAVIDGVMSVPPRTPVHIIDLIAGLDEAVYWGGLKTRGNLRFVVPSMSQSAEFFQIAADEANPGNYVRFLDATGAEIKRVKFDNAEEAATFASRASEVLNKGDWADRNLVRTVGNAERFVLSAFWLTFNPGFWLQNAVSAVAHTGLVDRTFTFKPSKSLDSWWATKIGSDGIQPTLRFQGGVGSTTDYLVNQNRILDRINQIWQGDHAFGEMGIAKKSSQVAGQRAWTMAWDNFVESSFIKALDGTSLDTAAKRDMAAALKDAGKTGSQKEVLGQYLEMLETQKIPFSLRSLGDDLEDVLDEEGMNALTVFLRKNTETDPAVVMENIKGIFDDSYRRFGRIAGEAAKPPGRSYFSDIDRAKDNAATFDRLMDSAKQSGMDMEQSRQRAQLLLNRIDQSEGRLQDIFKANIDAGREGGRRIRGFFDQIRQQRGNARRTVDELFMNINPTSADGAGTWSEYFEATWGTWDAYGDWLDAYTDTISNRLGNPGSGRRPDAWGRMSRQEQRLSEETLEMYAYRSLQKDLDSGAQSEEVIARVAQKYGDEQRIAKQVRKGFGAWNPSYENLYGVIDGEEIPLSSVSTPYALYTIDGTPVDWLGIDSEVVSAQSVDRLYIVDKATGDESVLWDSNRASFSKKGQQVNVRLGGEGGLEAPEAVLPNPSTVPDPRIDEIRAMDVADLQRTRGIELGASTPENAAAFEAVKKASRDYADVFSLRMADAASRYYTPASIDIVMSAERQVDNLGHIAAARVADARELMDADSIDTVEYYLRRNQLWRDMGEAVAYVYKQAMYDISQEYAIELGRAEFKFSFILGEGEVVGKLDNGQYAVNVNGTRLALPINDRFGVPEDVAARFDVSPIPTIPELEAEADQMIAKAAQEAERVRAQTDPGSVAAEVGFGVSDSEWNTRVSAFLDEEANGRYVARDGNGEALSAEVFWGDGKFYARNEADGKAFVDNNKIVSIDLMRPITSGDKRGMDEVVETLRRSDLEGMQPSLMDAPSGNAARMLGLAMDGSSDGAKIADEVTAATVKAGNTVPPSTYGMADVQLEMVDAAISRIEDNIQKVITGTPTQLSSAEVADLKAFAGSELLPAYDRATAAAMEAADRMVSFSMVNYDSGRFIDDMIGMVVPYHYWYTRSAKNWLERSMTRPAMAALLAREVSAVDRQNAREENPSRYGGRINIFTGAGGVSYHMTNPVLWAIPYLPHYLGGRYDDPTMARTKFEEYQRTSQSIGFGLMPWWNTLGLVLDGRANEIEFSSWSPQGDLGGQALTYAKGGYVNGTPSWYPYLAGREASYMSVRGGLTDSSKLSDTKVPETLAIHDHLYMEATGGEKLPYPDDLLNPENVTAAWEGAMRDKMWHKATQLFIGLNVMRQQPEDETLRDMQSEYHDAGYPENQYGGKMAQDGVLREYPELYSWWSRRDILPADEGRPLYPTVATENPDWENYVGEGGVDFFNRSVEYDRSRPGMTLGTLMRDEEMDQMRLAMDSEIDATIWSMQELGKENWEINREVWDIRTSYIGEAEDGGDLSVRELIEAKYSWADAGTMTDENWLKYKRLNPSEAALEVMYDVVTVAEHEFKDLKPRPRPQAPRWDDADITDDMSKQQIAAVWDERRASTLAYKNELEAHLHEQKEYEEAIYDYIETSMNDLAYLVEVSGGYPMQEQAAQDLIDALVDDYTPLDIDPQILNLIIEEQADKRRPDLPERAGLAVVPGELGEAAFQTKVGRNDTPVQREFREEYQQERDEKDANRNFDWLDQNRYWKAYRSYSRNRWSNWRRWKYYRNYRRGGRKYWRRGWRSNRWNSWSSRWKNWGKWPRWAQWPDRDWPSQLYYPGGREGVPSWLNEGNGKRAYYPQSIGEFRQNNAQRVPIRKWSPDDIARFGG